MGVTKDSTQNIFPLLKQPPSVSSQCTLEARVHVNNSKSTVEGGGKESEDFGSVTIKFT